MFALLGAVALPAGAFTSQNSKKAYADYLAAFYVQNGGNGYFRKTTATSDRTDFWMQAEEIEMAVDAYEFDKHPANLTILTELCNGFVANYGSNWEWNEYNDDIMWAVMAFTRVHGHTANANFLSIAKANFDMCFARAWDTPGGGLWWRTDNQSKNSCVNFPGAIAAYLLFTATGDTGYRQTSRTIFNWGKANLWNPNTGNVFDSLTNGGATSYNQGTFVGAANFLGDVASATLVANYTMNTMGSSLVEGGPRMLPNYDDTGDLGGFNGIGYRWIGRFMVERGLEANYLVWLRANANRALAIRNSAGLSWSKLHEQTPDGTQHSFGCSNAVVALSVIPPEDPAKNLVKVKSPKGVRMKTRKARIMVRGTAKESVSAVYLRNKRVSKKTLIEARGVAKWRARVALKPGVNKIDVLVDTGGAKPGRVAMIRVVRAR